MLMLTKVSYIQCVEICDVNEGVMHPMFEDTSKFDFFMFAVTAVNMLINESIYTIYQLNSSSTYQFVVQSLTLAGASETSIIVNATTAVDTRLSVVNLALISTGLILFSFLVVLGLLSILR